MKQDEIHPTVPKHFWHTTTVQSPNAGFKKWMRNCENYESTHKRVLVRAIEYTGHCTRRFSKLATRAESSGESPNISSLSKCDFHVDKEKSLVEPLCGSIMQSSRHNSHRKTSIMQSSRHDSPRSNSHHFILEPSKSSLFPAMTKIVGTLGPKSRSVKVISGCLKDGMAVARLDFSWEDPEYHQKTVENLKATVKSTKKLCAAIFHRQGTTFQNSFLWYWRKSTHQGG